MKHIILITFLTLSTFVIRAQTDKHSNKQSISKKRHKYIPKDLDDCINQIDNFWDDTTKAKAIALTEEEFRGHTTLPLAFGYVITGDYGKDHDFPNISIISAYIILMTCRELY
jgi:hypothetical protein